MKLPPFEEFMKSITPTYKIEDNNVNLLEDTNQEINQSESVSEFIAQQISRVCFNHIECYHNWLSEQLEQLEK